MFDKLTDGTYVMVKNEYYQGIKESYQRHQKVCLDMSYFLTQKGLIDEFYKEYPESKKLDDEYYDRAEKWANSLPKEQMEELINKMKSKN